MNSMGSHDPVESSIADIKVIGAGLARTGTMSLKKALEILYNQPCYHMSEMELLHKDHITKWHNIFKEVELNHNADLDSNLFHEILQGYGAVTSHTVGGLFEPLMKVYPDAKIIRTVRDLCTRTNEHIPQWLTSHGVGITKHSQEAKHLVNPSDAFKVVYQGRNKRSLAFAEAVAFHKMSPDLGVDKQTIILTVRDNEEWLKSVRDTVRPRTRIFDDNWVDRIIEYQTGGSCFTRLSESSKCHPMGKSVNLANDQALLKAFDEWNHKVQLTAPSDRLLVFNIKDGWKPLCNFLGLPLPDKEFPHANKRNVTRKRLNRILYIKRAVKYVLPAILFITVAVIFYEVM